MKKTLAAMSLTALSLTACGPGNTPPTTSTQKALAAVKTYTQTELDTLASATRALCDAAPAPKATGWDVAGTDKAAVATMKLQWGKARDAYEHVEGAIAVLFPELDVSTDERYDGFIETKGDDNLFDAEGVTGVHGIERILWSDSIPASVVDFESKLTGYKAAAFPKTETEAKDFKEKLCARLIADTAKMRDDFKPLTLDAATAYRGVVGSIAEQKEKVNLASTGQEESRYAERTLADMRSNLLGGQKTYEAFQALMKEKNATALDKEIMDGFARLEAAYAAVTGDAIPKPPTGWSSINPTAEHLMTPFGKLFAAVRKESDDKTDGTLVFEMNEAADKLGIPVLPE